MHVERVETAFRRVDAAPSANLSRAFEGLVAQHDELAHAIVEPRLRDVFHAAAALHVEHYELAGYRAAISFAERTGREEAASLLAENVGDEERAAGAARAAVERLASRG